MLSFLRPLLRPAEPEVALPGDEAPPALRVAALEALAGVLDPELGVDVVALGLVRHLRVHPGGLQLGLALTSAACPVGPWLCDQARDALAQALPAAGPVEVVVVRRPPWTPADMQPEARRRLGLEVG